MAGQELIVFDEYVHDTADHLGKFSAALGLMYSDYKAVLEELKAAAIKDGEVADSLDAFIGCVGMLDLKIEQVGNELSVTSNDFMVQIDEKDEYLFNA